MEVAKTLCCQNYVLFLLEAGTPNACNIIFHFYAKLTAPASIL